MNEEKRLAAEELRLAIVKRGEHVPEWGRKDREIDGEGMDRLKDLPLSEMHKITHFQKIFFGIVLSLRIWSVVLGVSFEIVLAKDLSLILLKENCVNFTDFVITRDALAATALLVAPVLLHIMFGSCVRCSDCGKPEDQLVLPTIGGASKSLLAKAYRMASWIIFLVAYFNCMVGDMVMQSSKRHQNMPLYGTCTTVQPLVFLRGYLLAIAAVATWPQLLPPRLYSNTEVYCNGPCQC